jgi:hypothetical protein
MQHFPDCLCLIQLVATFAEWLRFRFVCAETVSAALLYDLTFEGGDRQGTKNR